MSGGRPLDGAVDVLVAEHLAADPHALVVRRSCDLHGATCSARARRTPRAARRSRGARRRERRRAARPAMPSAISSACSGGVDRIVGAGDRRASAPGSRASSPRKSKRAIASQQRGVALGRRVEASMRPEAATDLGLARQAWREPARDDRVGDRLDARSRTSAARSSHGSGCRSVARRAREDEPLDAARARSRRATSPIAPPSESPQNETRSSPSASSSSSDVAAESSTAYGRRTASRRARAGRSAGRGTSGQRGDVRVPQLERRAERAGSTSTGAPRARRARGGAFMPCSSR